MITRCLVLKCDALYFFILESFHAFMSEMDTCNCFTVNLDLGWPRNFYHVMDSCNWFTVKLEFGFPRNLLHVMIRNLSPIWLSCFFVVHPTVRVGSTVADSRDHHMWSDVIRLFKIMHASDQACHSPCQICLRVFWCHHRHSAYTARCATTGTLSTTWHGSEFIKHSRSSIRRHGHLGECLFKLSSTASKWTKVWDIPITRLLPFSAI